VSEFVLFVVYALVFFDIYTNIECQTLPLFINFFNRGALQGWSASRQHVVAHRRGGREARLAQSGIREHDTFLGHEMRGPAGTGLGGVSMAGGQEAQGARKGNGMKGHCLPSPPYFF